MRDPSRSALSPYSSSELSTSIPIAIKQGVIRTTIKPIPIIHVCILETLCH